MTGFILSFSFCVFRLIHRKIIIAITAAMINDITTSTTVVEIALVGNDDLSGLSRDWDVYVIVNDNIEVIGAAVGNTNRSTK